MDATHTEAPPVRTEKPRTATETGELLRDTRGSVLVRGGGTKLDWAGRVEHPELVLDTTGLSGLLTHNPADLTASARAGTSLAEVQEVLGASGQWLAFDPPSAASGATLGGLLAAGDSGPSRLRYGGLRDLVIGVTLVLADGQVARSGGHVIKNVAGYDLAKLVHGSLGSLALVAEVVFRLQPLSRSRLTLVGAADPAQATEAALAVSASLLEPTAVEWISDPGTDAGSGLLLVRVDGSAGQVQSAGARLHELLAAHAVDAVVATDAVSSQVWAAQAAGVVGREDEAVLRISGLPSDFGGVATRVAELAGSAGVGVEIASSTALGMHTVRLRGSDLTQVAHVVTGLQQLAVTHRAGVLLRSRPRGLDELVDPLGPAPSSVTLLRRVKAQLDPDGRLAPGRFSPWF